MARSSKWYGWVPDLPDHRDRIIPRAARAHRPTAPEVGLRDICPPIWDQGALCSYTAHAIAAALEFGQRKQQLADVFDPSRLFIYYNERVTQELGQMRGCLASGFWTIKLVQ